MAQIIISQRLARHQL